MTTPPLDSSLDLDKVTRRHETFRMPILELRRLTKRFGDFAAVDDLSLDIAAGEFLTLLGASGSGKTTTLRMIAGFEPPTSGEILMDGTPIAALPPFKRDINTVFQHYALFPHMSVRDNIAYGLRMRRVPAAEREERVTQGAGDGQARPARRPVAPSAERRAAAAGGPRPGAGQPARACCCWTSRSARSTSSCGRRCSSSSSTCRPTWASPSST